MARALSSSSSSAGTLVGSAPLRLWRTLVSDLAPASRSLAHSARERALAVVLRARLVIAPLLGSLALSFAFFEPTRWRQVALVAAVALLFGMSLIEWFRFRRAGLRAVIVPLNLLLTVLGQLLVISATGGLFSPVVVALVIVVLLSALLAERSSAFVLVALIVPALWAFALVHTSGAPVPSLLPALFGSAQPIERTSAPWLAAGLYTLAMLIAVRVGAGLQTMFEQLHAAQLEERDRALALHAEQSRTLTTLSAEIAHELKNPLSSIKGLAALVAKDSTGRAVERMSVLRGEVDRMQTILEEFLHFSRPLVPLSVADLELGELVREVVRMHEASALERDVQVAVEEGREVHLRADPRKLRQVIINLLQNALEASPRGAQVFVACEQRAEHVRITVRDRGAGIMPELAPRLFEAGVTSKEHGSGLGLVVARALARQHGGELTLRDHPGGGALAELTLPQDADLRGVP